MIVWVDAQLPLNLALWLSQRFGLQTSTVRDLGLRESTDDAIFSAARDAGAVVMTKDSDFVALVERSGPPPQIVWVTAGNTSNAALQALLESTLPHAATLLANSEPLVEIGARPGAG